MNTIPKIILFMAGWMFGTMIISALEGNAIFTMVFAILCGVNLWLSKLNEE